MLIILIVAMGLGAVKGFAWQLASIASIVVSYIVAYRYREPVSQNIHWDEPWNRFLAMLILYIGTSFLIWMVFRMIGGVIDRMRLKEFDRQIGALFGLLKGALFCTLVTLFSVTLLGDRVRAAIVGSRSGNLIARVLDQTDIVMPPELQGVVQPVLDQFESSFQPEPQPVWFAPSQASSPRSAAPSNVTLPLHGNARAASSVQHPATRWQPNSPTSMGPRSAPAGQAPIWQQASPSWAPRETPWQR